MSIKTKRIFSELFPRGSSLGIEKKIIFTKN